MPKGQTIRNGIVITQTYFECLISNYRAPFLFVSPIVFYATIFYKLKCGPEKDEKKSDITRQLHQSQYTSKF